MVLWGTMVSILRVAGLVALSTGAWAQVGAIEGVVKYANGAIAKSAVIQVEREDVKSERKSSKTDKNGHYLCNDLAIGIYKLNLTLGGRVVESVDHVRTHPGGSTRINLVIKMPVP